MPSLNKPAKIRLDNELRPKEWERLKTIVSRNIATLEGKSVDRAVELICERGFSRPFRF